MVAAGVVNVGVEDVTKTNSNKSMDIESKSDSETDSATWKEKVNDDGSDQTVTKTKCTEKVTDDKSIQEVIKTDVDKSNSESEYDDEAIDIDKTDTEKGSSNGSSSGSSGSSSNSSDSKSNSRSSSSSGTDDSEKDSESANDDDDDNHSSNDGTQQLMSNKDSDNDDTLNDHMSSQHILPETKREPEHDTAEIQDDIAEPETGFLILERLMGEQEQLEFHAAEVGAKVDKHSKNLHYLVTDHQMNTCVCNFRIQNLSVASLQKSP